MITLEAFSHYKIGVPDIDDVHWKIVELMNTITANIRREQYSLVPDLMNSVYQMTKDHFHYELEHMLKNKFPFLEHHRREHQRLLEQLEGITKQSVDVTNIHRHFIDSIEEVVLKHIDTDDYQYGQFLKSQNFSERSC